ncbi:hypothetical protein CBW65_09130 [Tumebacillus avium]|uniref:Anaphase-promoting complex subunit 4 WD40 domain-containing protein n=1 Tax=Tumebacillus avium TaxID=1903704 RepID=A0A1Y0IKZ8_9BACL|nr:WD40 repeat domain-containing protein [Tumebacillus avium]ARU61178.1 hypothetical protein CBW65_09130 [Tumebacillus avium]
MHAGPITSVAVAEDGRTVYTCGYDKRVFKWDRQTGQAELLTLHEHLVNAISLSKDGQWLACASADYTVSLIDTVQNKRVRTLYGHHDDVEMALFAMNDSMLVTSSQDTRVKVWDLATGSIVTDFRHHSKVVNAIWVHEDKVFSAADDGKVFVWEMMTGSIVDELHFDRDLDCAGGHKECGLFAVGCDDGTVTLYDTESLSVVNRIQAHERGVKAICFSPSGSRFLTAGYDHQIKIWRVADGALLQTLPSHRYQWERAFAWTPDEQSVIGGSFGRMYTEWLVAEGLFVERGIELATPAFNDVAVSQNGDIVTASDDGKFRVNGEYRGHHNLVLTNGVGVSDDGRLGAWGDHFGYVHVMDLHTGEILHSLNTGTGPVNSIKYWGENHSFYVGTYGGHIHRLCLNSGKWKMQLQAATGAVKALEVDEERMISGASEGKIYIFDRHTLERRAELVGPTLIVNDVSLDRTRNRVAVVSRDNVVRLYDLAACTLLAQHKLHRYSIKSVTVLDDGTVVSGDYWGEAVVWNPDKDVLHKIRVGWNGISGLTSHQGSAYAASYDGGVYKIAADGTFEEAFRLFDQSQTFTEPALQEV